MYTFRKDHFIFGGTIKFIRGFKLMALSIIHTLVKVEGHQKGQGHLSQYIKHVSLHIWDVAHFEAYGVQSSLQINKV